MIPDIYREIAPQRPRSLSLQAEWHVLRLWRSGLDTYAIALNLNIPEFQAANLLAQQREQERRESDWNSPVVSRVSDRAEGAGRDD